MSNLYKLKPYADGRDYADGAGYCSSYGSGAGDGGCGHMLMYSYTHWPVWHFTPQFYQL